MGAITRYKAWYKIVCRIYGLSSLGYQRKERYPSMRAGRLLLHGLCLKDNIPNPELNIYADFQQKVHGLAPDPLLLNWVYNLYKDEL